MHSRIGVQNQNHPDRAAEIQPHRRQEERGLRTFGRSAGGEYVSALLRKFPGGHTPYARVCASHEHDASIEWSASQLRHAQV